MSYNVMRAYYLDQHLHQVNRGTPARNLQHLQRYARESQKIRPKRPKSDPPITFWNGFRLGVRVRILYNNPQPPHISRKNFVSLCINCYPLIRRGELLWLKPNTEKQGVAFYYGLWLDLYRCLVRRLGWRMATSGSRSSVSLVWWWWSSTTASSYR